MTTNTYVQEVSELKKQLQSCQDIKQARSIEKQADTLATAWKTVHRSIEKANPLNEIAVEAAVKIGKLLGPGKVGSHHSDASEGTIDKDARHRYRKISGIKPEVRQAYYADCYDHTESISQNGTLRFGTGSRHAGLAGMVEWYTPSDIIYRVHKVLGKIDLDPASSRDANKVVKAKKIYTEDDDGLTKDWHGKVFCNPPFSHPTCRYFSERMLDQYAAGNVSEGILLIQANCDLGYWHELIRNGIACLSRGRVKFYRDEETTNPTLGTAIFYFGGRKKAFAKAFDGFGVIIRSAE